MRKLFGFTAAALCSLSILLAAPAQAAAATSNVAPTAAQVASSKLYYVTASTLNVRANAGATAAVLGKLRKGQAVKVISAAGNGWTTIIYNGKTAYVSSAYIAPAAASFGKEFTVQATAYTPAESSTGLTAFGYNIKKNPTMKLIAVDPKVIPLGSKVWVEGYGEAVAGDTGGAIKGNKIDVLLPTIKQALTFGRKNVKVKVLR